MSELTEAAEAFVDSLHLDNYESARAFIAALAALEGRAHDHDGDDAPALTVKAAKK